MCSAGAGVAWNLKVENEAYRDRTYSHLLWALHSQLRIPAHFVSSTAPMDSMRVDDVIRPFSLLHPQTWTD